MRTVRRLQAAAGDAYDRADGLPAGDIPVTNAGGPRCNDVAVFDDKLCILQGIEDLTIEQLISQAGAKARMR